MKSIALKLWLGMMGLVAVVLILLWLFQIVFLDKFYTNLRITEIQKKGEDIVEELVQEDLEEFKRDLDQLIYENNGTGEFIDTEYQTMYATGGNGQMPMMMNHIKGEIYKEVLEGKVVNASTTHPRFGSEFQMIGLPVKVANEVQGGVFITIPMAPVEDTVIILKKQLFYITIILLISAVVVSFLLSRTFTRPILDIIQVSRKMASGDLSSRVDFQRKDEIGRLGEAINHMAMELSKIEKLRKDLVANVSHELRTPLSLIKGYAEAIRDISGNDQEKRKKHTEIIIEESNRLSNIVEDILNLSQIQAGYVTLQITSFDIQHTLQRVQKRFEIIREQLGIEICIENLNDMNVLGDEARIEQVLYNLINNGLNHSSKGTTIQVKSMEIDDRVRIEVSDTGGGIPQEEIPYIWERFYKVPKSKRTTMVGTGLGLAIVKSILLAHEAPFGVESQVGIGTTFWFELKKIIIDVKGA